MRSLIVFIPLVTLRAYLTVAKEDEDFAGNQGIPCCHKTEKRFVRATV